MTLAASFDDATGAVTLSVSAAPTSVTAAYLQRSTDQVTWTDVRGAQAVPVSAGAATFRDYEYAAGTTNFYRATYDVSFASFVSVGAVATANNASVTPALPAGVVAGDLEIAFASIASAVSGSGRITTPAGWTPILGTPAGVNLYWRIHTTGAGSPTFVFTGGVSGDETMAQLAAFRHMAGTAPVAAVSSNAAVQNIAFPSLFAPDTGIAILAAWKQNPTITTATAPPDLTLMDKQSAAGTDGESQLWWWQPIGGGLTFGAGSITVTGGGAAVSKGVVISFAGLDQDTATVTPNQTSVWLKNPLRPFLNRPVTVVDMDDIVRTSRSGVFDVINRTLPVTVTDLMSGRSTTLTLRTTDRVSADDLDGMIAVGEVLLVQPPAPGSPVPTMYAVPGGSTRQRVANTSAVRRFPLGLTECATPDLTLAAVQSTCQTVLNTYATIADLIAAKATCEDVLLIVGTAEDVLTS